MVDVKVEIEEYAAFPTMVYKFSPNLSSDMHSEMSAFIKAGDETQTEDNIQIMSIFHPLVGWDLHRQNCNGKLFVKIRE